MSPVRFEKQGRDPFIYYTKKEEKKLKVEKKVRELSEKLSVSEDEIMKKITCIAVDDEPLAQSVIQQYAQKLPNLTIIGTCNDAICAHDFLRKTQVDLLFLDIK